MFVFMWILIVVSLQLVRIECTTCHFTNGKSICSRIKCDKNLKCKGNKIKDGCGCCDRCLKQRGEVCGGPLDQLGKCDHHNKYCIKRTGWEIGRCYALKDALKFESSKHIIKMRKCRKSNEYDQVTKNDYLSCFLNVNGPTFYCKKEPQYRIDDCCIHNNACHPNRSLYDKINVDINTSHLMDTNKGKTT